MVSFATIIVVRCAIWYHLHKLKNVKNTRGGVLILVNLQATTPPGVFSCFLNCTNGTKSRNAPELTNKTINCCKAFLLRCLRDLWIHLSAHLSNLQTKAESGRFTQIRPQADNYMFKVNNINTRTRCKIYSKLTTKTPERRN